jgi:hypothetical protein
MATDGPLTTTLPVFDLGDVPPIAAFIIAHAERADFRSAL